MTTTVERQAGPVKICPGCANRDVTYEHVVQCAERRRLTDHLLVHASTLDQPPAEVHVRDLLAHLSGDYAAVQMVIDLGWRKTVGAS